MRSNNNAEKNIAVLEFKSISRGIIAADEIVKAAPVKIVIATTLCPGKYICIVEGELSAVTKAIQTAEKIGRRHLNSSFAIGSVNPEILDVIGSDRKKELMDAAGIVESLYMADIINAADISLDSADVELVELRLGRGCGVNSYYVLTGKLEAVKEAAKNAAEFLKEQGSLIASRVISNPDLQLLRYLEPAKCMC